MRCLLSHFTFSRLSYALRKSKAFFLLLLASGFYFIIHIRRMCTQKRAFNLSRNVKIELARFRFVIIVVMESADIKCEMSIGAFDMFSGHLKMKINFVSC